MVVGVGKDGADSRRDLDKTRLGGDLRFGGSLGGGVADAPRGGAVCLPVVAVVEIAVHADFAAHRLGEVDRKDFGHKKFSCKTPLVPLQRGKPQSGSLVLGWLLRGSFFRVACPICDLSFGVSGVFYTCYAVWL